MPKLDSSILNSHGCSKNKNILQVTYFPRMMKSAKSTKLFGKI